MAAKLARFRTVNDASPEPPSSGIRSPFAETQSSLTSRSGAKRTRAILIAAAIVLGLIVAGIVLTRSLRNPLRTLRPFPVDDYYERYSSLEGTRFKASIRALGQIGWNKEVGRLVNFTVEPEGKPIVALLPSKLDSQTFETGQRFDAELMVEEGGIIRINYLVQP